MKYGLKQLSRCTQQSPHPLPPTPFPLFLVVIETVVELPLALLSGPRAALQAETAQVLLEVLVVHRTVILGFTVHLGGEGGGREARNQPPFIQNQAVLLLRRHTPC